VIIEEVVPSADYVVVSKETNPDDKFNEIADAEGIPVLEIDSAFDLIEVFNNLFSL
jgi:phosphopantetheine adenylyltransferase